MEGILERMKSSPLVFDGAMGTMIYERGVFINTCFDELCLTNPKLISQIHAEYVEAGAEVIETNTFGANRIALRPTGSPSGPWRSTATRFGSPGRWRADRCTSQAPWVPASSDQIMPDEHAVEVEEAFSEQIAALAAEGVDLVVLETFTHLKELQLGPDGQAAGRAGARVVRPERPGRDRRGNEGGHHRPGARRRRERGRDRDQLRDRPRGGLRRLQSVLPLVGKPVVVMPNAGFPRDIGGRLLYLTSPEYFTEYAKKYIELGVRAVGGCCGTTPAHIRVASRAIKSLSGVKNTRRSVRTPSRGSWSRSSPPRGSRGWPAKYSGRDGHLGGNRSPPIQRSLGDAGQGGNAPRRESTRSTFPTARGPAPASPP